jgi:methylase of polypeptide subunit release factors
MLVPGAGHHPAVGDDGRMTRALVDERGIDQLRTALAGYTVDAVIERLGLVGQAALNRADLAGVARAVRGNDRLATLIRLFVVGLPVDDRAARHALAPLPPEAAVAAGLVEFSAGSARALLDVRPYAEHSAAAPGEPAPASAPWWVVSDFGADVRGGPLAPDHVVGIGAAALTLAQATPRTPVDRALDIGTGCGVQALHLSRHATEVVATDISARALELAATTAALSGRHWDLRRGSLLEPVAGRRFDLVVANPPFVVSDGAGGYDYRDSGLAGDAVCETLVRGLPGVLADGGTAQLLANWMIAADRPWEERLGDWLAGAGCDAWVWQREIAEPAEYVALWLRDAGETPGTPRWTSRYNAWLDWFAAAETAAVGMGLITLWRTDSADPVVVCEDVPQAYEQPIGSELPRWHGRRRWLRGASDAAVLATALRPAADLVLERADVLGAAGWSTATARLRQSHGLRWEVDTDEAISGLVAACDGVRPVGVLVALLAAASGQPAADVAEAALPVLRDLVARGFLLPGDAA